MEEIKKIQRVLSRQGGALRVLLALDAVTGQNGLLQARAFTEALQCDGVFLAKLDGSAKGGVVVAIAAELKLPVLFVGTGEQLEDVAPFDPREFVDALFGAGRPE
jgi:fused signal recognition particle receptor